MTFEPNPVTTEQLVQHLTDNVGTEVGCKDIRESAKTLKLSITACKRLKSYKLHRQRTKSFKKLNVHTKHLLLRKKQTMFLIKIRLMFPLVTTLQRKLSHQQSSILYSLQVYLQTVRLYQLNRHALQLIGS